MYSSKFFKYTSTSSGRFRNCIKPLLGIKISIKVDNYGYQKIKYPILIYNHGYQKIKHPSIIYDCDSQFFLKSSFQLKL